MRRPDRSGPAQVTPAGDDREEVPFDEPLFEEPERAPVEGGLIYLGAIVAGIIAVVGWLVWKYTAG